MSLAITFCNSHGIVMSADRWITTTVDNCSFCSTKTEQKIFLSPEGFGFTYTGASKFNERPVSFWMKRFIARFSGRELSVSEYVRKLCMAFHSLDPAKNVIIIGAGHESNTYQVYSCNSSELNLIDHLPNKEYCIVFSGENNLALKIIDAIPIEKQSFTISDMTEFVKHVTLTVSNIQRFAQTPKTVGPDCDILVITDTTSTWIVKPFDERF